MPSNEHMQPTSLSVTSTESAASPLTSAAPALRSRLIRSVGPLSCTLRAGESHDLNAGDDVDPAGARSTREKTDEQLSANGMEFARWMGR